jgi:hypothetical protein
MGFVFRIAVLVLSATLILPLRAANALISKQDAPTVAARWLRRSHKLPTARAV